jgi:hypothetical protein
MTQARLLVPLLLLAPGLLAVPAGADERKVTPTLAFKQEYSDNLFFEADNRESDWISTLSPGLNLLNNTERLKAGLKMRWDGALYQENSDLNTVDQDYAGTLRYGLSPRANLFSSASYRRDSRTDRDFAETGLALDAVKRDQYRLQLGGDYALTEIVGMQLQYGYAEDDYQTTRYTDYQSHDVNWMITRDLSAFLANTVGRINLGVTQYDDDNSQMHNYTGTVGAERKLSEVYSFFADIGMRYTETTYDTYRWVATANPLVFVAVPYEAQTDGSGITGRAGVTYRGERNDGRLSLSHDVQAASGNSGTVERTALQAQVGRRLTETSRFDFSAGYAINKSTVDETYADSVDENSLWIQPRITYTLTDNIVLEGSYNYALIHDNAADDDRDRNLVMLRLAFQYPLFE